ncbi:hypothetical protein GOP47_0025370 [Adiantum capillus-veneris]|uniref:Uncharacterized protein n=1 Tax=Adiantum capillus-veneris TaxID=13818 RepID=A0A9D4Z420_ADICA|nr:hypothetical protein GOP47_0025370 [Adiantum capillus-veneris]
MGEALFLIASLKQSKQELAGGRRSILGNLAKSMDSSVKLSKFAEALNFCIHALQGEDLGLVSFWLAPFQLCSTTKTADAQHG